jgi:iron complex outermembrane recepter protein
MNLGRNSRFLAATSGLALAAALTVSSPVFAQAAPEASVEVEDGLEIVIVTAQRRSENLQSVPLSVTAFTTAQLRAQGATDLSRLENRVPGFTFGRSGSDARPAMRGVRTENVGVNGDTTIGMFVDGVYLSRASQGTLSFVDVEAVEVQRGPQGTLYGRNTFGGNIAITSGQPSLRENFGGADFTIGENDGIRAEGFANFVTSDTSAVRLAGAVERNDGWVKNDGLGNNLFDAETAYVRASLLLEPVEGLRAVFKAEHSTQGGAGGSAFGYKLAGTYFSVPNNLQLYNATPITNLNTRGGNRDGVVDAPLTIDNGVPIYAPGNPYRIDTDQPTVLDLTNTAFTANISYELGPVILRSITGYTDFEAIRTSDTDFSNNTIGIDYQLTAAQTLSQEFQIVSNTDGPLDYVAGLYFFRDELIGRFINQQTPRIIRNVTPNQSLAQNGGGFYDEQRPETESFAAYAQVNFNVSDQLRLTAGIRYTEDTKDFKFANANAVLPLSGTTPNGALITLETGGIPASAYGVQGGATNCTFTTFPPPRTGFQCLAANTTVLTGATYDTATFDKVTWRLAADYQLTDTNLLYASVSTGFRSGGFNSGQNQAALTPTFKPEEVTALEVGSKNRFLDNTLQINIAAFFNQYENLQEQRQIPAGATTLSIIENSGKAEATGAEFEVLWRPSGTNLTMGGTLSLLNAEYTEYKDVPLPFGTSILVTDAAQLTATVVNGVTIAPAGQRRIFAPGYNCGLIAGTGGPGQAAAAFGCDLTGNKIPYSPEYSGSIYGSYKFDLGSMGTLTPYVAVSFSGEFYGQPFNSILERQDAFLKTDVSLTWDMNDRISARAFVNNVTDEATATRFVWGGGGALQASYAPPRLAGASVSIRY